MPDGKITLPSSQQLRKEVASRKKRKHPETAGNPGYWALVEEQKAMQELLDQTWAAFTEEITSISKMREEVNRLKEMVEGFDARFRKAMKMLGAHNV
jgi:hypothetical protein